jgi:hypothetical protein
MSVSKRPLLSSPLVLGAMALAVSVRLCSFQDCGMTWAWMLDPTQNDLACIRGARYPRTHSSGLGVGLLGNDSDNLLVFSGDCCHWRAVRL